MNSKALSLLAVILAFVAVLLSQAKPEATPSPPSRDNPYYEPSGCDMLNGIMGSSDIDTDGVQNCDDNCIFDWNKNQRDENKDGVGDACESRKLADAEWEKVGRHQSLTATEPVDLERLVEQSTNILVVRIIEGAAVNERYIEGAVVNEKESPLSTHRQVRIVRELKGEAKRAPSFIFRGIWVWVPDGSGRGLFPNSDLLIFLKNGKLRQWRAPLVFSADLINGKPYVETDYYGYELADPKFGVLGVSESRLKQLEEIIRRK